MTHPFAKHSSVSELAPTLPTTIPARAPGRSSPVQRRYGGLPSTRCHPLDMPAAHARGQSHRATDAARPASPDPFDFSYVVQRARETVQRQAARDGDQLEDDVLGPEDELEDDVLGPEDELEDDVLGPEDELEDDVLGPEDDHAVQGKDMASHEDAGQVHAAAARGIQGGAQELRFRAQIEASTGQDLSGVKAHIGGAAADASAAMGAEAYATGNHVAFAKQPDLHTAAHEAAHVVQQRAGVQLLGGVGQVGDPYERQADEVADAVVRGQSAEGVLTAAEGGQGSASVQRKEGDGDKSKARAIGLAANQLLACWHAIDKGADEAITALSFDDQKPREGWVVTLLSAAGAALFASMTGVAGTVAGAVATSVVGVEAQAKLTERAVGSAISAALKFAVGEGSTDGKDLLAAFQLVQNTKLLEGLTVMNGFIADSFMPGLDHLDTSVIRSIASGLQTAATGDEIKGAASLSTMTEWVNFVARVNHGAQTASDTNIGSSPGLIDTGVGASAQRAKTRMKGVMRASIMYKKSGDQTQSTLFKLKLQGVDAAAVTSIKNGYTTILEAPINRIVDLHHWNGQFGSPIMSVYVGADDAVQLMSHDSGHKHLTADEVWEMARHLPLAKLS